MPDVRKKGYPFSVGIRFRQKELCLRANEAQSSAPLLYKLYHILLTQSMGSCDFLFGN